MMKMKMRHYIDRITLQALLPHLFDIIRCTNVQDPHEGLIIAEHVFHNKPYPIINEFELLSLAVMDLLNQFAYPSIPGYAKFTVDLTMINSNDDDITFTLNKAISLTDYDGIHIVHKIDVFSLIYDNIVESAENYDGVSVRKVKIRVYVEGTKRVRTPQTQEMREENLYSIFEDYDEENAQPARKIRNRNRSYPGHITAQKRCKNRELKAFIVADLETLVHENIHYPYAAGLLKVRPGKVFSVMDIETYFSEDYSRFLGTIEEKSTKILYDFILRLEGLSRRDNKSYTIYFHNGSKFDGIILLKHLTVYHKYKLKPLMRNRILYELAVYSGKRLLFRFKDSLNLVTGSLDSLARNLCPNLGFKGSINHDEVTQQNVGSQREMLLEYMKQDILLLGGVMQKAQSIYWDQYKIDIESVLTISSLAITIFRSQYYDESNWPIHIPNRNEDSFIRGCYYGGHVDVYKPSGDNLYYYDVNSLYPFIMKEYALPGGVPVWHADLKGKDLDSICGFIRAYVKCPKSMKKPFLPVRSSNNTLIFPTGEFIGDYYSEEFKFARTLGYTVYPISGYLFERKESPFKEYVSTLYERRLEARKNGDNAIALLCKNLMNSLYGRFGISPISTKSEICDQVRYNYMMKKPEFQFGDKLSDNKYIITYHTGTDESYWKPPSNSAVQLSAAITGLARIYMYPFISRDDCYYTDTDSVVLGNPLSPEYLSSTVLGKFKLEAEIEHGYFLAPKAYGYKIKESSIDSNSNTVCKYKGAGKEYANYDWFEVQYQHIDLTTEEPVKSFFTLDLHTCQIKITERKTSLGITLGTKRIPVKKGNLWVDTEPIEIKELSTLNDCSKKIIRYLWEEYCYYKTESQHLKEELEKVKDKKGVEELKKDQTSLTLLDKTFDENTSEQMIIKDPDDP